MKKFLKLWFKKINWLLVFIFAAAFFVRLYNFQTRVVYGPEQGLSLLTAAQDIKSPSLLGIPYLLRQTSAGMQLYHSPLFLYSLIPFILLFKFDVLNITLMFTLLNILTGVILYFVAKEIFGKRIAAIASVIFLFSDYMIYHSLFIWISNYMPLVGIATTYLVYKYLREPKKKILWVFLLGLVSGIGFGIQYLYLLGIIFLAIIIAWKSKRKLIDLGLFIFGLLIGELPTVIFDLKHGFYHVKTLFAYFLDTLQHPGQSQISYYHFLVLWPLAAILVALLFVKINKKSNLAMILLLIPYIIINLSSSRISFTHAVGMPAGLTAKNVLTAAKIINQNATDNFNVSVLMDFDNRGYVLRYPLEFIYKKNALSVEDYPKAKSLYVLANKNYDFRKPDIWEVASYQPYKVNLVGSVNDNYGVYKLTK